MILGLLFVYQRNTSGVFWEVMGDAGDFDMAGYCGIDHLFLVPVTSAFVANPKDNQQ